MQVSCPTCYSSTFGLSNAGLLVKEVIVSLSRALDRYNHIYKILFERNPRLQKDWPCPVCLANCSTVEVVVETGNEHIGTQELARCHSCRSWFFLGAEPVLGYQHEDIDARYWFHYVQVGAGIDFMLRPLMALGSEKRGQLLDVGCGFGFVPDFWSRSGRGRGVGLEAAEYGKAGRELLGVELYSELIDECEAIRGPQTPVHIKGSYRWGPPSPLKAHLAFLFDRFLKAGNCAFW